MFSSKIKWIRQKYHYLSDIERVTACCYLQGAVHAHIRCSVEEFSLVTLFGTTLRTWKGTPLGAIYRYHRTTKAELDEFSVRFRATQDIGALLKYMLSKDNNIYQYIGKQKTRGSKIETNVYRVVQFRL